MKNGGATTDLRAVRPLDELGERICILGPSNSGKSTLATITQARWVMDGNYTRCLDRRLARATGFILLDVPTTTSLLRYLRRTWFQRDRAGALAGSRDSVKWSMVHHIAVATPPKRQAWARMFDAVELPKVHLATPDALERFYRSEGLDRKAVRPAAR